MGGDLCQLSSGLPTSLLGGRASWPVAKHLPLPDQLTVPYPPHTPALGCLTSRLFLPDPQVVTSRDSQETLLVIAFVFEVSTSEHGAQHHVYKLVKD